MKVYYSKWFVWIISGFLLFSAIRKLVYIFSEVYIDIPLISYLTDHPYVAIWVLFVISVVELTAVFILLFGNNHIQDFILMILVNFVIIGIIFSVVELIYFGESCFCGISKTPVISISVKVGLLLLLLAYRRTGRKTLVLKEIR
ncbi:hypothetical protein [Gracilimonas mengyeensis]|uniref:Uncharacterized protein n=1 Tax=Gracilimonas mengyeensis TaxID=1302730 RepID=A0A521E408_9BACT|nr:hypothetical protein [Gracilimonas mengyeensis]SMO78667.1 hypothetical protein SAMN06265219_110137 [Gracilimonas mengyeensis]